ncbi:glutamyl-tRNA amidotransferase subunit C [Anopheles sinensis]|uniref:Glutamyl-tRNA amidotransferase subunit C n=1 Tax=Anopheles sinensis TaxID=74873 RepID=A0A084VBX6_ANOSI|nr:glutamyl-tRNA amidotransferase subunit C [Anopheles sinensis]
MTFGELAAHANESGMDWEHVHGKQQNIDESNNRMHRRDGKWPPATSKPIGSETYLRPDLGQDLVGCLVGAVVDLTLGSVWTRVCN